MRNLRFAVAALVLMVAVSVSADESATTTRVFQIEHTTVAEASNAVQPLLSENGTLTVQPQKNRITVQDSAEIVRRVAEVLAELDIAPGTYSVRFQLLKATQSEVAPEHRVQVNRKIQQMFPSARYVEIGSTLIEGELKVPVTARIGEAYRLSFVAEPVTAPKDVPFGMPKMGSRYTLEDLKLTRSRRNENGDQSMIDVIQSDVSISPGQKTSIGTGASEDSKNGLVLIIEAISVTTASEVE
jgi:hypothetical protein